MNSTPRVRPPSQSTTPKNLRQLATSSTVEQNSPSVLSGSIPAMQFSVNTSQTSYMLKSDVEIAQSLTEKLLQIREQNEQLQTELDLIFNNEQLNKRENTILDLQAQLKQIQQQIKFKQTESKNQQIAQNERKHVNGINIIDTLQNQLENIKEKHQELDDETLLSMEQLQFYKNAEINLNQLIPQHYYQLLKPRTTQIQKQQFDLCIQRMRTQFETTKAKTIEQKVNYMKKANTSQISFELIQELKGKNQQLSVLYRHKQENHISMSKQLQNQKEELEIQLLELANNYEILLNEFKTQIESREEE
ncbi:Conserved_hypothetical protein [Hexamita inflata]|uniref:Uncharacterized protein n=1 Tax=Hexamita inflata TaxID=28002 RepID=A0ABP1I0W6_9EUKA